MEQAQVIKNMNVRPMLDRAEFERLEAPKQGAMVNLRVGDEVKYEEVEGEVIKVSVARTVASNPECIFKIYVEMSAEVQVDKKAFDALKDKEDFLKKSPVARMLTAQIATVVANLTANSAIGPMITVPMVQA